ncbi:hypothetical protein EW026_g3803 [Hermanssonia centrifuga]|uniref:Uncharacterized protein n=1 Tax=Hermanssonia centrifuga TaxID=98765 RepID=A0A4S4KJ52_9APHY|nr:hypothetical protein EW026_g3803 [Hermanssonia centrifuga]
MTSTSQSAAGPSTVAVPAVSRQTSPLLASYLAQLAVHPLRTKSITLGTLQFLQEILASHLAGVPPKRVPKDAPMYQHLLARAKIDSKAIKMALYGFCISAPLGHTLVGLLQKAFAGKTTTKDKIMQILASNLILAPVQISGAPLSLCLKVGSDTDFGSYTVYLASMAVINGAKSVDEVLRTVKGGFMNVMRITWITSPLSLIVAQKYLSPELWVPFFNFIQFVAGTYFNTKVKKMQLAAADKKQKEKDTKGKDD